jgi:hypothetical protein
MPDSFDTRRGGRRANSAGVLVRGLIVAIVALASGPVHADDFVDQVNDAYVGVSDSNRSDLVILPLFIDFQAPPVFLRTPMEAALLPAGSANWQAAADWAAAEPQQALIKAIAQVTKNDDFRTAMQFAQPYGIEGVAGKMDLISAGLYTELGDPPTLAAAKHGYMPAMRNLELLAHVEATRLAAEGDVAGAVKHMINWALFTRQFADRQFLEEKKWAMSALRLALARTRDLAYSDFKSDQPGLQADVVLDCLKRIEQGGYLALDRLSLPQGNFIGAEQLVRRVIDEPSEGGRPDPTEFALTMSTIAAAEHPLRLFAEAAFWRTAAGTHAGWHESLDMADRVPADWERRWLLRPGDPVLTTETDYERMVLKGGQYSVLVYALAGVQDLFLIRRELSVEIPGTRIALALYGYQRSFNAFAPAVTSVRPRFLPTIERDPFSRSGDYFQYFVPIKDTPQGPRGEIRPWDVEVFPPEPYEAFVVPFTEIQDNVDNARWSDFILYSVGPDDRRGRCGYVTQADPSYREGDYIVWPPLLSLLRQRLLDSGELE